MSELAVVVRDSPVCWLGTSTWSPRRYLLLPKVSLLGSGLIWRLAGLLRLVGSLLLLVSARVLLIR